MSVSINIPISAFGKEFDNVKIEECEPEKYNENTNGDAVLLNKYGLYRNGLRLGDIEIQYLGRGDKNYDEDLTDNFDYQVPGEDPKFIQGLIQLSVGYFHITNNNMNGALGLLRKCKPKFELYTPICRGLNVDYIID